MKPKPSGIYYHLTFVRSSVFLAMLLNLPWLLVPPELLLHGQQTLLHLPHRSFVHVFSSSTRNSAIPKEAFFLYSGSQFNPGLPYLSCLINIIIFILSQNKLVIFFLAIIIFFALIWFVDFLCS